MIDGASIELTCGPVLDIKCLIVCEKVILFKKNTSTSIFFQLSYIWKTFNRKLFALPHWTKEMQY